MFTLSLVLLVSSIFFGIWAARTCCLPLFVPAFASIIGLFVILAIDDNNKTQGYMDRAKAEGCEYVTHEHGILYFDCKGKIEMRKQ